MHRSSLRVALAAIALTSCARNDAPALRTATDTTVSGAPYAYQRIPLDTSHAPGTIIDSVFPMPEMLARFRAGLPALTALQDAPSSRRALVDAFVRALAASDRIALGKLTLSRAEFAYLYFPNTPAASAANGLPPQRRWDQLTLSSEKGIGRALDRLGGKPLVLQAIDCAKPPVTTGAMTLHPSCTVRLRLADGSTFTGPLFGPILELAGGFKFVDYSNDM